MGCGYLSPHSVNRGIILMPVTGIEDVNRPKVYPNQGSQTRIMTFHKHT